MDAQDSSVNRLYQKANWLALITIYYNLLEGAVSVFFGFQDETLSLFGFGVDSFVEVISGIGVWHMIHRFRQSTDEKIDRFEQRALKITGTAFYLLTAGLTVTAAIQYLFRSPSGVHFLGDRYFPDFHRVHVGTYSFQGQSGNRLEFPGHSGRRGMHPDLFDPFRSSAGSQPHL